MKEKFKISLLNNGIHSFSRGLDELITYEKDSEKDNFKLKEAIIFLHHGIELLLKQVLIDNKGEYLIFDNINSETVKKIIEAKNKNISVFNLKKPVHTASYLDVIQRIKAFIDSPDLDESIETRLIELNAFRNNLEHYGIDIDKSKVENLILNLYKPITKFLREAGIVLGTDNENKWRELEQQLIIEASRLRAGGRVKALLYEKIAEIEYIENYNEYKKLQPQSTLTEEQLKSYWESGDAILKAINDGGVRLMMKIDEIDEVRIKIPYKENIYSICVKREEVESFLGYKFDEIRDKWDDTFSNKYVYSKEGRKEFFSKFGKIEDK